MLLNVLVTGAAGLIGGELCAQLCLRGHAVTALVHKRAQVRGNDGAPVPLAATLKGDITSPSLGITSPPGSFDLIVHCAAALEFDAPAAHLRAINVEGTRHVVELARANGARLLHVSTAYVCGLADGPIAEAPVAPDTRFANNYETSKAEAERIVQASGVPHAIARPSVVLGDSRNGAIREFPAICNLFRLMARGTVGVLPVAEHATLDFVPIDFVAHGLALLAERMDQAQECCVHLTSGDPMPAAALPRALARHPGFPDPRIVPPEDFTPALLPPAERRVLERLLASYGNYFRRSPLFATDRFRALTGLACPPTDEAWLDRLVAHAIDRGYLPSPQPAFPSDQRMSG